MFSLSTINVKIQTSNDRHVDNLFYLAKQADESPSSACKTISGTADNVCIVTACTRYGNETYFVTYLLVDETVLLEGNTVRNREQALAGLRDSAEILMADKGISSLNKTREKEKEIREMEEIRARFFRRAAGEGSE